MEVVKNYVLQDVFSDARAQLMYCLSCRTQNIKSNDRQAGSLKLGRKSQ